MGFLDYAGTLSLQKDPLQMKILIDPRLTYPILMLDGEIPVAKLPEPKATEEAIEFLGYRFPQDDEGKAAAGRLFRAAVIHISAHALAKLPPLIEAGSYAATFAETTLRDLHVDSCVASICPERLADLAYANALAMDSVKWLGKIYLPATRVMAAIMSRLFAGRTLAGLVEEEAEMVEEAVGRLRKAKGLFSASVVGGDVNIEQIRELADWLRVRISEFGPFVEVPSFPHTENASACSIYTGCPPRRDREIEPYFLDAMEAMGASPPEGVMASCWRKEVEVEALQAFSSTIIQREKERKFLGNIEERLSPHRFKSIEVPPEDYSEYLMARDYIGGSTRRLLNNIIMATNFEFEDIRKNYGVLDLADAIQVVASDSPRNDIFMRDEIMKQSFSIVVLLDVSRSMGTSPFENKARAICVAESAKDIITDSNSWAFYAFSDRLYVIKDGSEAYSRRVRARIGGVPFDGATYMPDAIKAAAEFLKGKTEEQRIIIVLSDGYPFGYPEVEEALEEVTRTYQERDVIIIGLGFDTERMRAFFKYNTAIYSQRDLIKRVGSIFLQASQDELL